MKFSEVVAQTLVWLQRDGRVSYRALKREFALDDDFLEDVKAELIEAKRVAVDENGKVLVWVGISSLETSVQSLESEEPGRVPTVQTLDPRRQTLDAVAERRQLTVMFCDLVGSTALSTQLDPEDLREVVRQYQQTCAGVIQRHDGYVAQYLGDGLLVYFGYPTAHEDDARRAVRAGMEIVEALHHFAPSPALAGEGWGEGRLQVRVGIHTGLVVVGEIGGGERREQLALGDTPNIAARLQGLAEPNTVLISAATQRLIEGQFECQPFGSHLLKGIDTPLAVYQVQSERQGISPLIGKATLTPLVGREQEVGLLFDRWEQVKEGRGQVVLLSGEPGIGKSRLAYTLREHVTHEGSLLFEARCSPYHQHSALYPLIEGLQRTLRLTRQDTDEEKVIKLERALALYGMQDTVPFFTALLSLPTPSQYPPLTLTPQKQKERTFQALLQLLIAQAERQATVLVWEDLHWADPSSLEILSLLIEQLATTKLLLVLTFRPEFIPPWKPRSHISHLVLNRLGQKQVEAMIEKVAADQDLPAEIIEQIRLKTDGVPLFVEELTKSVIESIGSVGSIESIGSPHPTLRQLAIPATLQEALLARLDRLSDARQVAQLGATLGREFSQELLQAVAPLNETDLQAALAKLVEAEILYQRGVGEQARYFFKHALIQDTAYQSLLKSTRQQYHHQTVQVLEERFPDTKATQPELLAYHYTEANLIERAIPYWQQAGQKAAERSANVEAIAHLTKGLELLKTLPDTLGRTQQELMLQIAIGSPLMVVRGYAAPELEKVYARARELSQQVGETPQLGWVLYGLWAFYFGRAALHTAQELAEQIFTLVQRTQHSLFLLCGRFVMAGTLLHRGEFVAAREHAEQGIGLYDRYRSQRSAWQAHHFGVFYLNCIAWVLWVLGYPDQAVRKAQEGLTMAQKMALPMTRAQALGYLARFHQNLGEQQATEQRADALVTLCTEQRFPLWQAEGTIMLGWALAEQGRGEEGVAQIRQGLADYRATGAELILPDSLALLAAVYQKRGQVEEGLNVVTEALTRVEKTGGRMWEAELYRLAGELSLRIGEPETVAEESENRGRGETEISTRESVSSSPVPRFPGSPVLSSSARFPVSSPEDSFLKAIEIARQQQAKSWELRATTSLARLWQSQGKKAEAQKILADVYNWFTEGFDTKDLQEAKALLQELSQ
jgi:class 3 adenylate cyclase/predicted ATPase